MSQSSRPRDPRMEVSDALPSIPDDRWVQADALLFSPDADTDAAAHLAAGSLSRLQQRAQEGQASATAVLAMFGSDAPDAAAIFIDLWGGAETRPDTDKRPPNGAAMLYEIAANSVCAGHDREAVLPLAVLAGLEAGEGEALLGLAVIATRQQRMDVAFDLVSGCLERADRHPRVCSIAGVCELARGNKAAAQTYLAAASRIARTRPEFRGELQIAQRALLLMHLA